MKAEYLPYRASMTTPQGMAVWQRGFDQWKNAINVNDDALVQYVQVTSIDSPALSDYSGVNYGNMLVAYDANYFTVYAWKTSGVVNSPYVVTGDGGYWEAVAGRYVNTAGRVNSLTASRLMASDANKGLSSADIFDWVLPTVNRIETTDNLDGTMTVTTADALEIPDFTNAAHTHQDAAGGAQLDHGLSMTAASLLDDDHPNLHNDARGDARYYTQAQVDSLVVSGIDSILCRNGEVLTYKGNVLTYG